MVAAVDEALVMTHDEVETPKSLQVFKETKTERPPIWESVGI
jgi:hypothetical protein